ncbi:tripartite motif-containing protein 5-like [Hyaena hyaena]|uniref:tripartite motif-containing protein 5-like n=1 Tax=Hyaena hyaena TaxID=95912 RepID=UPI0019248B51|nr:tripartite motif-containing protein 5-like [Hyaena hyaena]
MAFELVTSLREEVTCPICLDLLTEPLSLDCGHSFCQACITAKTKESMKSHGGESSCPVCRISYCSGELRPNWHVANIVERLREVKVSPEEGQKINLCERHEEKLLLFCKRDGKVICWLCEQSQEHRGHHTVLVEEVAREFQEKLQAALWKLKEDQQEARMLEAVIGEKRTYWKKQLQTERQSIQAQFKKLKDILECEELRELQNLESEEKAVLGSLAAAEDELTQQSQLVMGLISDLERRLQGSTMDMLQDVNHLVERSEALSLKKPKTFLKEQRNVSSRGPDLKKIMQAFEKAHVISY